MDMSYLQPLVERLEAQFPQVRNAVPPLPLAPVEGTFGISVDNVFADLARKAAAGELHLRAPVQSPEGLVGPMRGIGDCLAPILQGNLSWFDPHMPAQDGDLVLVRWHPRTLDGIIRRGSRDFAWLTRYSAQPGPFATKLLKRVGNEYYLVTNESMLPLGRNRILGVLRYAIDSDGSPLYGSSDVPVTHRIGINATSQIVSATFSGATTVSYPIAGTIVDTDMLGTSINVIGYTIGVDASVDFKVQSSNNNFISSCLVTIRRDGADVGTAQFDANAAYSAGTLTFWEGQVTLSVVDTPAAGSHTYTFHARGNAGGTLGGTQGIRYTNPTLKIREYKR